MTLLEITEPLFQYICRLNRIARRSSGAKPAGDTSFATLSREAAASAAPVVPARGANLDYAVARSEIKALFAAGHLTALPAPTLSLNSGETAAK